LGVFARVELTGREGQATSSGRPIQLREFLNLPFASIWQRIYYFRSQSSVTLLEWHERQKIRAGLFDLSDREPHDIGISSREIDYVASIRSTDPPAIG